MRLARDKFLESFKDGEERTVKKISEPEFILYAKIEINKMFAEAVTENNIDKLADIIEIINKTCEILNIDFYNCMKIKSDRRWKLGKFDLILVSDNQPDSREEPEI